MSPVRTILFLCPHGAAKGVLAAAYFQRLADQRGLAYRADAAGTGPEPVINPAVVSAPAEEGLDVAGRRPRRVTGGELAAAHRVVSIGWDLAGLVPDGPGVVVERWDDVPLVSRDLAGARAAIAKRVAALVDALERP